jgi:ABC-type Fe3+ transport system permease subunit
MSQVDAVQNETSVSKKIDSKTVFLIVCVILLVIVLAGWSWYAYYMWSTPDNDKELWKSLMALPLIVGTFAGVPMLVTAISLKAEKTN